jgi:hypothetical protein
MLFIYNEDIKEKNQVSWDLLKLSTCEKVLVKKKAVNPR